MVTEPGGPLEERVIEFPARLKGHLLGLHGQTIEIIRQTSGVIKCHMQEKSGVDSWGNIHVQIVGSPEKVETCVQLIEGVKIGDHSGIGHVTQYLHIDPSVVGKIMGHKGQTIKELTEYIGCYIEIQQYPEQGVLDGRPRLFIVGEGSNVSQALDIIDRFIASPGSRLEGVLGPRVKTQAPAQESASQAPAQNNAASQITAALTALAALAGGASAESLASAARSAAASYDTGAVEERIIEVPTCKKGHLLGLHGQTIEKIRQTSGVKKCHMMDKTGTGSWGGTIPVQIVGTRDRVERCIELVQGVVAGDHSGIGHATDIIAIEPGKINGLMGHRGQTVTLLKDVTSTYLDIQQGPQPGVPAGEARLFMAGPPENVRQAKVVVAAFLAMMDHIPSLGESDASSLTDVLKLLNATAGAGGALPQGAMGGCHG